MHYKAAAKAIRGLKIQGAEGIALAGVSSLLSCKNYSELKAAVKLLSAARPTEPCLRNAFEFAIKGLKPRGFERELQERVSKITRHFKEAAERISLYGSRRIKAGSVIFTHCHSSTVVGVLIRAWKNGVRFRVCNTETRPFLQGRITAKELARAGIPVTIFVDSAARQALRQADIMLIGADAITSEGFIVNKMGSEIFAEVAAGFNVPVYVCTNSWKFDGRTLFGFDEELEERFSAEVWRNPPKGVGVSNVVFEKVHPRLITAIISELGLTSVDGFLNSVKEAYPWIS